MAEETPLKVLFVKLKHIGDALLLTPTVMAIRKQHPRAEIWVVVRKGTEGILAGCPAIDRLITVTPVDAEGQGLRNAWRDFQTWREIRRQKFDYAFELTDGDRGRWLAGLSGAKNRCVNVSRYPLRFWWRQWFNRTSDSEWMQGHRVEKDFHAINDFLPLGEDIPPLCFEQSKTKGPDSGGRDFAVFHPGTRWVKKRWPKANWLQLAKDLLERVDRIVISCGPDEEERAFAKELLRGLDSDRVASTDGQLDWSQLAGLLYRARVFVGVDTAAMHLAAACQCPIVSFFTVSVQSQWRPWKAPCELLSLPEENTKHQTAEVVLGWVPNPLTPEVALAAVERMIRPAQQSP